MKLGTKSVLFGAHCFLLHPFFVARAWWKLYGFPWAPWLWIAFFVHDIGYIGKPNMDGPEGEQHPRVGANVLYRIQSWWIFLNLPVFYSNPRAGLRWWHLRRRADVAYIRVANQPTIWGNEVLYHSRYFAKRYGAQPSRLCMADKLAFALTPRWLYLPMVRVTGEIREYMDVAHTRVKSGESLSAAEVSATTSGDQVAWYEGVKSYMLRYVEEHRDGKTDTWTGSQSVPAKGAGVWP